MALQVLFALDATGALEGPGRATLDVDRALAGYWAAFEDREAQADELEPEARAFAEGVVCELLPRIEEVDEVLRKCSTHWRLERMPRVDRNVARIAAFELLARRDVPRAVVIDEAVELAKKFGGDESARFVNGVLERVADEAGRIDEPRAEGAEKTAASGPARPPRPARPARG